MCKHRFPEHQQNIPRLSTKNFLSSQCYKIFPNLLGKSHFKVNLRNTAAACAEFVIELTECNVNECSNL